MKPKPDRETHQALQESRTYCYIRADTIEVSSLHQKTTKNQLEYFSCYRLKSAQEIGEYLLGGVNSSHEKHSTWIIENGMHPHSQRATSQLGANTFATQQVNLAPNCVLFWVALLFGRRQ